MVTDPEKKPLPIAVGLTSPPTLSANENPPIYAGPDVGGGSGSFNDEEPILDELGIHPDQIWKKILRLG